MPAAKAAIINKNDGLLPLFHPKGHFVRPSMKWRSVNRGAQMSDFKEAAPMFDAIPDAKALLADKGYASDRSARHSKRAA